VVIDSSVWLEVAFSGPLSTECEKAISPNSVVPSIILFEVYKKIRLKRDESRALEFVGFLSRFSIHELSREVALLAADLSIEFNLAMADSFVLAHAKYLHTTLVTLDNDFSGISDVKVIR
jgi:toxin FitB